jgi:hypothetical protein
MPESHLHVLHLLGALIRIPNPDKVAVYSGRKRPVIPIQSGHLFRFKAATDSG